MPKQKTSYNNTPSKFDHRMKLKRQLVYAKKKMGLLSEIKTQTGEDNEQNSHPNDSISSIQTRERLVKPMDKKKDKLRQLEEENRRKQKDKLKLSQEREKECSERAQQIEAAKTKREDMKNKMKKRTKRGQPIMKYRIQSLVDKINKSSDT